MNREPGRPVRLLLVREWDAQTSASGCCGRLSADAVGVLAEHAPVADPYAHTRADMVDFGAVYRALWERFGDSGGRPVEIDVVDPRNMVWLVGAIWMDARRRGLRAGEAARQVRAGTATRALVCDGVALFSGRIPEPAEAVNAVAAELRAAR